MNRCPYCSATERQIKSGMNASGSQRFRCRACDRHYTPAPATNGYPEEMRRQAIKLYIDGMNLRRIGRVLGVVHQTVANRVTAYHASLPAPSAPVTVPAVVEVDELFTFVSSKKRQPTSSRR